MPGLSGRGVELPRDRGRVFVEDLEMVFCRETAVLVDERTRGCSEVPDKNQVRRVIIAMHV